MSNFNRCPNCHEWAFLDSHTCQPEWKAICADYDDESEPGKIFGLDAESAATKYADQNFSSWEYPDEMEIWVRQGDEEWQKFSVSVELVPEFTATRIK